MVKPILGDEIEKYFDFKDNLSLKNSLEKFEGN